MTAGSTSDCGCMNIAGALVFRCEKHRDPRLQKAFEDGIANAAPRAARASAMAGARRRRYQKRTKKEEGA